MLDRNPLWQLTLSRLRGFVREPSALFWSFIFPVILAIVLGVAFRSRPPEPVFAVIASGEGAEQLRVTLAASPEVHVWIEEIETARHSLHSGRAALLIRDGSPRTYEFDP